MDWKYYEGKIILLLIDVCTRLSVAVTLRNKQPNTVIKVLFRIYIFNFGAAEKCLEVVNSPNEDLINLDEKFWITIKTVSGKYDFVHVSFFKQKLKWK